MCIRDRAIRVLGIVVLAPLLEELAFRGVLFHLLLPRIGSGPTVAATALLFALAHGQYGPPELVQVLVDGLLLGLARLRTGSTRVPFWMHLLGNGLAAWQRLASAAQAEVRRPQSPGPLVERGVRLAKGEARHARRT